MSRLNSEGGFEKFVAAILKPKCIITYDAKFTNLPCHETTEFYTAHFDKDLEAEKWNLLNRFNATRAYVNKERTMRILRIMSLCDFVKHDTYKCTSITHHGSHRNSVQAPGVFPLGAQGRPISLINDVRFVMRILSAARCAKLKLRCLIYRCQEDEARRRKINCDLQATRREDCRKSVRSAETRTGSRKMRVSRVRDVISRGETSAWVAYTEARR